MHACSPVMQPLIIIINTCLNSRLPLLCLASKRRSPSHEKESKERQQRRVVSIKVSSTKTEKWLLL